MPSCVFCAIVARQSPAEIEFEDDEVLAFRDIYPKAPVHLLIVPKRHIDAVMTLGMGHPIGPLRLADLIGLDVCVAIMEVLSRDLGDKKYAPPPNLVALVREGRLGRKSGRGVYTYASGATA